jgi:hypothetical protein
MKLKELALKWWFSVQCPTCGAAAGERCELHSGGLRSEPRINRRFAAIESAEKKSG